MNAKDVMGDRLKIQEQIECARKADSSKPLMCRLDGRAFHTFTKGLNRPYDQRLSQLMIDTAKFLVNETHAKLGYTQSDEITLCWWNTNDESSYLFGGKYQKLTSIIASMASVYFNKELENKIPEKAFSKTSKLQLFDARAWNVDNLQEAFDNFHWRQDDAIKNSISMAAQAHFSSKLLHGVSGEDKKKMLRDMGNPWENQPTFFKMGTFVQRQSHQILLTPETLSKIPTQHHPSGPVMRSKVYELEEQYIMNSDYLKEIFR